MCVCVCVCVCVCARARVCVCVCVCPPISRTYRCRIVGFTLMTFAYPHFLISLMNTCWNDLRNYETHMQTHTHTHKHTHTHITHTIHKKEKHLTLVSMLHSSNKSWHSLLRILIYLLLSHIIKLYLFKLHRISMKIITFIN